MDYVRKYKNTQTGEIVLGELQGSGGIAVPLGDILAVIKLARRGRFTKRFYAPKPGCVKIWRIPESRELAYDDPNGHVVWPLADLEVL